MSIESCSSTVKCEPKVAARCSYYDHTASHWQTPATYETYLENVIIPDKTATIARLNLKSTSGSEVYSAPRFTLLP